VQRSWTLVPCFLTAARDAGQEVLDVVELGPSAGLNLVWDRYRYRYAQGAWGGAGALVELSGEEHRPVPAGLLKLSPCVRRRVGIDASPIDVTTEAGARLLRSFVWPDQSWRLHLLDRAIAALRDDPPELVRGDFVEELPRLLAGRQPGALTLVFQTAVTGYVDEEGWRRVQAALRRAGEDGTLAYVWTARPDEGEHTYWGVFLRLCPGGETRLLAHADFHGAWLRWLP